MGSPAPDSRPSIRFGVYELDPRTGELRKHGMRIKLQDQPFAILMMLLERPGELVTREEIQQRLWPADTFVDFDHSLNTAIRRLRDALCDSADTPRFIETLPRRGYRFIGPVESTVRGPARDSEAPGTVKIDGISMLKAAEVEPGTAKIDAVSLLKAAEEEPDTAKIDALAMLKAAETEPDTAKIDAVAMLAEAEKQAAEDAAATIAATAESAGARRQTAVVEIALVVIALAAVVGGFLAWKSAQRPAIDSVAVLPFVNATQDADLDYLSDGIAESVMANLSQIPTLKVMSRNSVFHYKGKAVDPPQAARELGVRAVLLGTMRQHESQLRISLELVDARDGRQLWGADFERPRAEAVQMEREISQQTSEKLRLRLTGEQQDRMARQHVPPPEAYENYLRGHQALQSRHKDKLQQGLELLQRSIDADPQYGNAYAELAAAYGLLAFYGGMEPRQAYLREEAAVRRAVELNPDSARSRVQMGYFLADAHRDFKGAEREWKRAIEMEPNMAEAHHGYSMLLMAQGRFDAALRESRTAEELDPLWPGERGTTSSILLVAGRLEEAEQHAQNAGSGFPPSIWILGQIYEQQGKYDKAIETFKESVKQSGQNSFLAAMLAHTYAAAGQRKDAQAILANLLELHRNSYYSPVNIARVYVALGDQSSAVKWLRIGDEQRDPWLSRIQTEPNFEPLRKLPEFQAIVRKAMTPD